MSSVTIESILLHNDKTNLSLIYGRLGASIGYASFFNF
jgi:hypothetical protein